MKYFRFSIGVLLMMAAACSVEEVEYEPSDPTVRNRPVYYAAIDDESSTRTLIDADLNVLWNKGDRLTIFPNNTLGSEYEFQGEDRAPSGDLASVEAENDGVYHVGTELDGYDYAIYPHSKDTKILSNGSITYTFPDVQTYQEKSFGRGANVMVARTTHGNFNLGFKNVLGYLSFRFYGTNVHVSSIILEANGGESISGTGTIVMGDDGPVVTMGESASNRIRLYCDDVVLGNSATEYTEFWFALPPVAFTKAKGGFKITVTTTDGGVFTRDAAIDLTIKRKTVERMNPLQVVPTYQTANNMAIKSLSSPRNDVTDKTTYDATSSNGEFTLTIPTKTDFSHLQINFTLKTSSDILMVGGKKVESGDIIDASQEETSLVVCRENIEKTFKLITQNTGLPVVRITLPEGSTLSTIEDDEDHSDWVDGTTIHIDNADGTISLNDTPMAMKGRGNATWKYPKRPYALKFDPKVNLLGLNNGERDKRWILLANWRDRTLLRNDAAFWLSKRSGLAYTVDGTFVELEINGQHRGNYYLCEQIKIGGKRVNIPEMFKNGSTDYTGGFLMEIDSYYDELNKFISSKFHLKYMFKDPDEDRVVKPQYADAYTYMQNYINTFETVLKNESAVTRGDYEEYLDVNSAIWFMLINELTENRDFFQTAKTGTYAYDDPNNVYGPHSTYLYKDTEGNGGKLVMGPVWDFDYETFVPAKWFENNWGNGYFKWRGFDRNGYYYYFLCHNQSFVNSVKSLWSQLYRNGELTSEFYTYVNRTANKIRLSQQFDDEMWPYIGDEHTSGNDPLSHQNNNHDYGLEFMDDDDTDEDETKEDAIKRMKTSFKARAEWMNDKIVNLKITNPTDREWNSQ